MNNTLAILNQMLSMSNNPQTIINNLVNQNPQVKIALNQMQQSGMTPQQYVLQYAKQTNSNIQPLLNAMAQRGIKL